MIAIESRAARRIIGRLDRGADLFEALLGVCREHRIRTAEVRALGSLESVEVAEYDQARKTWKPGRTFSGGMEVLSLTGNISEKQGALALHAHASLMRDRDNGVEIIGGHLNAGKVFALEFVLDAFDDVILRRGSDPATGLGLWTEALPLGPPVEAAAATSAPPRPVVTPPPARPISARPLEPAASTRAQDAAPPPKATWADVAQASAQLAEPREGDEDEEERGGDAAEEISLEPGDILIHPTFGRCEVQRIEGSYEYAHLRLKNGRLVRLSIEIFKLAREGHENGRRVLRAQPND